MVVSSTLITSAAVVVNGANPVIHKATYNNLVDNRICYGNHATLFAYSDRAVFSADGSYGFNTNCKYASCTSYKYIESDHSYVAQSSKKTGYRNSPSISTYNGDTNGNYAGALYTDVETDKICYYAVIFNGGTNQTGMYERFWVYKYRNKELPKID